MGESPGKDLGREKTSTAAVVVCLLLFVLLVWAGLGWAVYELLS